MKRILTHLRGQTPEVRLGIAIVLALIVTGIIAGLWIATRTLSMKNNRARRAETATVHEAPKPFQVFGQSIKQVFQKSDVKNLKSPQTLQTSETSSTSTSTTSTIEIIDTSEPAPSTNPE